MKRPKCARATTCRRCGCRVWIAPASSSLIHERLMYSRWVVLEPVRGDALGNLCVSSDGTSVTIAGKSEYSGDLCKHNCPDFLVTCKYCGKQVIVLSQRPGVVPRLAVVDADEDEDGTVVIDGDSYAVPDPGFVMEGERHRWHSQH